MGLVLIGVIEEYKRYPKGEGEKRVQKGWWGEGSVT